MSEVALGQIRKHPSLSEFCEPLPPLIEAGPTDLSRSVNRFGELLGTRQQPVSLGFRIIGDVVRYWRLQLDPQGFNVTEESAESEESAQPDIEVIVVEQAWRRVAEGSISPMEAMFAGQLRFRGDVVLARSIVRQLRRARAAQSAKG